jgi:hypothetical protein
VGGSGATSGTAASGAGGTGAGSGAGGTGATSGAATGASSGTASGSSSGTGSSGSGGTIGMMKSAGCGKPLPAGFTPNKYTPQPTGCTNGGNNQGSAQCQAIPVGSTVPAKATSGSPEYRGWQVLVPNNYDPNKAYRVIYNGAGCFDPDWFHAGADGYPYQTVDNDQAILVGLDYDTYSSLLGCYDNRNATSNDFKFFPWLQNTIENQFCVDINHEFFSGYSSGGWVGQQFNCAFPDKLRGEVLVTGCEPGSPNDPFKATGDSQPPCVNKPSAVFYVHDTLDTDNPYNCMIPGCARMLAQNGCTVTKCDPTDATLTTPYSVTAIAGTPPQGVDLAIANAKCVQFNGCPAEYPVVFCYTNYAPNHHADGQAFGVVKLFWDFMSNKLAN